ncbi:MAG: 50S ribosomal protein L23 [Dysgonamonadaceae bacterium]
MGIIVKPILTEKQTAITEKYPNRFAFRVLPSANKVQIKEEVEKLYGVKVVSVNTALYAGKNKSRFTKAGVVKGSTPAYKKAIVTLKEGEVIDFFSNI